MALIMTEIIVAGSILRPRENLDLSGWLDGLSSVLFPTSIKARMKRGGEWEDCIASARLSDEGPDSICITLYFQDATSFTVKGKKHSFYTPEYSAAKELEKQERSLRKRTSA